MGISMIAFMWSSTQGNSAELTRLYCRALHHFNVPLVLSFHGVVYYNIPPCHVKWGEHLLGDSSEYYSADI